MNSPRLFKAYIDNHDPGRVSRHLREILLGFIAYTLETGLPVEFQTYLREFDDLFNLLDQAGDEKVNESIA